MYNKLYNKNNMLNYSALNKLVKQTKLTKVEFAKQCGITRVTLDNALQGGDIRISILDSIAKVLKVPAGSLFDDVTPGVSVNGDKNQVNLHGAHDNINGYAEKLILEERIKSLEAIIEEKERLIKVLMEGRK